MTDQLLLTRVKLRIVIAQAAVHRSEQVLPRKRLIQYQRTVIFPFAYESFLILGDCAANVDRLDVGVYGSNAADHF